MTYALKENIAGQTLDIYRTDTRDTAWMHTRAHHLSMIRHWPNLTVVDPLWYLDVTPALAPVFLEAMNRDPENKVGVCRVCMARQ